MAFVFIRLVLLPRPVPSRNLAIGGEIYISLQRMLRLWTIPRLVGSNSSSWGWCLKTLKVYHDSRKYRHGVSYPRYYKYQRRQIEHHRFWSQIYTMTLRKLKTCTRDVDEKLRVPETFYMLLDMDRGTLAFQVIFEKHNDISRKYIFYC